MPYLTLYTTLGCHLCEQAKALAWPVLEHHGYRLREVDIADDEALMLRYGVRIPVMSRADIEAELGWPFSQRELSDYLSEPAPA